MKQRGFGLGGAADCLGILHDHGARSYQPRHHSPRQRYRSHHCRAPLIRPKLRKMRFARPRRALHQHSPLRPRLGRVQRGQRQRIGGRDEEIRTPAGAAQRQIEGQLPWHSLALLPLGRAIVNLPRVKAAGLIPL
jgi:hypothetical protein